VRSSVQDIGSGIRTLLAQVVAEELGLRPEDISVHVGDTDFPPGPSSGGSKTAGSVTPAARKAEDKVGTMLPCNVVVQQKEDGSVEVSAVDPVTSMHPIDHVGVDAVA
jgi:CO/xanthine dehydrogenase Mo-binding subunit